MVIFGQATSHALLASVDPPVHDPSDEEWGIRLATALRGVNLNDPFSRAAAYVGAHIPRIQVNDRRDVAACRYERMRLLCRRMT